MYRWAAAAIRSKSARVSSDAWAANAPPSGLAAVASSSRTGTSRRVSARRLGQALRQAGFECELLTVPAGETAKDLKTVRACYDRLAALRLERKSFILALGGGVVGDLAGFVAATYLRGIAVCAGAHNAAGASGQLGRRQGGGEPQGGQEPGRRLLPAPAGALRPRDPRLAAGTRVPRRTGRGHQIRHYLRRRAVQAPGTRPARPYAAGARHAGRRGGPLLPNQGRGRRARTRRKAACAPS